MKFILPILAIASLTASSQSKINISGLQQLESICSKTLSRAAEAPIVETLVKMNEDWNADILSQFDAEEVLQVSDNIIIIRIPADKLIEFSKNDAVSYVEYGVEYQAELDFARPGSFVSDVQAGFSYDGAEVSYKGRGVVTGLMDVGIDPNHVNFTDAEGKCRVKAAYDYNNNISATSTTAMKRFTTDNTKETHGTHVAGIMAGSYNGTGSYYYIEEANSSTQIQGSERIPYYGVATESSIVMAGGALSNTNILKGIKASIDYAKRVNQPVVVNLSLGTNQGAHDGSSVFDESIATYGQQGIICISAGNDGDMPMFAGKTFTTDDCTLRTVIKGNKFAGVDIWSNSSEPLTVSLCTLAGTKLTPVASVSTAPATSTTDDNFAKYANGTVKLTSEINSRNKRFHVLMSGAFTECTRTVVIQVEGKAGQQVYLYGLSGNVNGNDEYTCFTNNNKSGYTDGTTDGTISDMACADNIIAVGSYNTRITWPTFSRVGRYIGFSVGDVSPFSSFGEKYQGVQLPVICAPGANIISSLNSHYTDNLSESALKSSTSASAEPTIKTNPTNYCNRCKVRPCHVPMYQVQLHCGWKLIPL